MVCDLSAVMIRAPGFPGGFCGFRSILHGLDGNAQTTRSQHEKRPAHSAGHSETVKNPLFSQHMAAKLRKIRNIILNLRRIREFTLDHLRGQPLLSLLNMIPLFRPGAKEKMWSELCRIDGKGRPSPELPTGEKLRVIVRVDADVLA